MVAFYNFRQEIDAFGIPQNVEQFEFRQKCKEYKSRVSELENLFLITKIECYILGSKNLAKDTQPLTMQEKYTLMN